MNNFTLDTDTVLCYIYIKMNEKKETLWNVKHSTLGTNGTHIKAYDYPHAWKIARRLYGDDCKIKRVN